MGGKQRRYTWKPAQRLPGFPHKAAALGSPALLLLRSPLAAGASTCARHTGHTALLASQVSTQAAWKQWEQAGSTRAVSPSPNASRHTAQVLLCRPRMASEVSCTAGSAAIASSARPFASGWPEQ